MDETSPPKIENLDKFLDPYQSQQKPKKSNSCLWYSVPLVVVALCIAAGVESNINHRPQEQLPTIVNTTFASLAAVNDAAVRIAWGFGGSSMQMEGGWDQDGKGPNVFDTAYLNTNARPSHGTPFRAADHYNRYKEDLAFLGQFGATAYRFSVSWARILPNCTGAVNPAGIQFYSDMIDEILKNGAEPFLTMFHWDLPQACQDQFSGFQSDQIVEAFAEYANVLLTHYGDRVNYWLTLNEPRANCDFCVHRPQFAPFTSTSEAVFYKCMHNSILAHGLVVQNARRMPNSKNWKFSLPSITDWIDPEPVNPTSFSSSTLLQTEWYFDPCFLGDYGPNIKALYPLPAFHDCAEGNVERKLRFHCTGLPDLPPGENENYLAQEADDPTALTYWPNPRPEGTRLLPKFLYDRYKKEVVITELGYHVPRAVESTFEQSVQDDLRVQFWQVNGPEILALATEDKVPITAVLAWSLIDNYEFETYEFRWGHVAVDYWDPATGKVNTDKGSLRREPKKSLYYMSEFFGNNTVSPFNPASRIKGTTTVSAIQPSASGDWPTSLPAKPAKSGAGVPGFNALVTAVYCMVSLLEL
ncbi:glycoside hydrolase superfamily [Obelidium mucronatum]|nr:glycoside hydrolase superfamily [Obelidium mucronatum]